MSLTEGILRRAHAWFVRSPLWHLVDHHDIVNVKIIEVAARVAINVAGSDFQNVTSCFQGERNHCDLGEPFIGLVFYQRAGDVDAVDLNDIEIKADMTRLQHQDRSRVHDDATGGAEGEFMILTTINAEPPLRLVTEMLNSGDDPDVSISRRYERISRRRRKADDLKRKRHYQSCHNYSRFTHTLFHELADHLVS